MADHRVDPASTLAEYELSEAEMIDLMYGLLGHVEKKLEDTCKHMDDTFAKISGTV